MGCTRLARLLLLGALFTGCGERDRADYDFELNPSDNPHGEMLDNTGPAVAPHVSGGTINTSGTGLSDGETMTMLATASQASIDAATLALSRTLSDETRAFATRMMDSNMRLATLESGLFMHLGV